MDFVILYGSKQRDKWYDKSGWLHNEVYILNSGTLPALREDTEWNRPIWQYTVHNDRQCTF